jgi:hypothetical protein
LFISLNYIDFYKKFAWQETLTNVSKKFNKF